MKGNIFQLINLRQGSSLRREDAACAKESRKYPRKLKRPGGEKMRSGRPVLFILGICFTAVFMLFTLGGHEAGAQEIMTKEVIIKVKPDIIVLPQGEAARIPVSAARVRSTELRALNEQYKLANIEKLYELEEEQPETPPEAIKGLKSLETEPGAGRVNLESIFTYELKEEMKAQGKKTREIPDVFLFEFQFSTPDEVNILELLASYQAADVVLFAQDIIRAK